MSPVVTTIVQSPLYHSTGDFSFRNRRLTWKHPVYSCCLDRHQVFHGDWFSLIFWSLPSLLCALNWDHDPGLSIQFALIFQSPRSLRSALLVYDSLYLPLLLLFSPPFSFWLIVSFKCPLINLFSLCSVPFYFCSWPWPWLLMLPFKNITFQKLGKASIRKMKEMSTTLKFSSSFFATGLRDITAWQ